MISGASGLTIPHTAEAGIGSHLQTSPECALSVLENFQDSQGLSFYRRSTLILVRYVKELRMCLGRGVTLV